jgi:hypothetical protein
MRWIRLRLLVAVSLPLWLAAGCGPSTEAPRSDAAHPVDGTDLSSLPPPDLQATDAGTPIDLSGAPDQAGPEAELFAAPAGIGTACSLAAPCSLTQAQAVARSRAASMTGNLIVNLRGGTYRLASTLQFNPNDSGMNGYQIIYRAYQNEQPLLSGALQISGFQLSDPSHQIWRAPVPPGVFGRQLFVDGVRAVRPSTVRGSISFTPTSRGLATVSATSLFSWALRAGIEVTQDNAWKHLRCPVIAIEPTSVTTPLLHDDGSPYPTPASSGITLVIAPACWTNNMLAVPNLGYPLNGAGLPRLDNVSTVENVFELLSSPGQFYVDSAAHYLYYIPRSGENLATADVELPVLETLLAVSGTPGHLAPVNDNDANAVYSADVMAYPKRGYGDFGDDAHATQSATGTVAFTFTGTGVDVLGEVNSDEGNLDVTVVDKATGQVVKREMVSAFAAARLSQQVLCSISGLTRGSYQITLQKHAADSTFLVVDGFVVLGDTIARAHDLAFRGLSFAHSTWTLPSQAGYVDNQAGVLWDADSHAPIRIPGGVTVHRGQRIEFTGNTFSHLGGAGLELADGTQDSTVVGNRFDDLSAGAVLVGEVDDFYLNDSMANGQARMTSGITVSNNAVTHTGVEYHDTTAIWVGNSRTTTLSQNLIAHTSYSGISLGWGWGWAADCTQQLAAGASTCRRGTTYSGGNQIINNRIYDVMRTLYDGGPIYTLGGQSAVNQVAPTLFGNVVSTSANCPQMLYHDEGSTFWQTNGNLAYDSVCRWLGIWAATEHDITAGRSTPNYTDNPQAALVGGSNNLIDAPVLIPFNNWPQAATDIESRSGLQAPYRALTPMTQTINDADAALRYSTDSQGTQWQANTLRGYGDAADDVHYASTDGAQALLTFYGTGVDVLGEKNSDQGNVELFVDGASKGMVNTGLPAGAARQAQQVIYGIHALPMGSHTIAVVKRSGQYATLDGFHLDQPVSEISASP